MSALRITRLGDVVTIQAPDRAALVLSADEAEELAVELGAVVPGDEIARLRGLLAYAADAPTLEAARRICRDALIGVTGAGDYREVRARCEGGDDREEG